MKNEFWINLATSDLKRARQFYSDIGFEMNDRHGNPEMLSMLVGNKSVVLCLFSEAFMNGAMGNQKVTNTKESNEVLFSYGANSRAEVDEWAKKAVKAGAKMFSEPADIQGWMYGCGFSDPDGHRWNILFMDMANMPKQ